MSLTSLYPLEKTIEKAFALTKRQWISNYIFQNTQALFRLLEYTEDRQLYAKYIASIQKLICVFIFIKLNYIINQYGMNQMFMNAGVV